MFYTFLIVYILGGLTFVPLVIVCGLVYTFYTADPIDPPSLQPNVSHSSIVKEKRSSSSSTTTDNRVPTLKTWLTVRRTFEALPSSYISLVRTLLDSRSAHARRAEDAYFAVLKGATLYLYEDEAMSECTAAIDVARCHVRVFPEEGLLDGELFAKRNALIIREVECDENEQSVGSSSTQSAPWFIFFRSVTLMEDWYFALLAAPRIVPSPNSEALGVFAPYPYTAHHALITSLDALPDLIPTRWLNALLGRLFLGVKGTRAVEAWVIGRLMKKISKVKTPGFLSAIVVRSFDAGDVAPVLSKPMLKELTPDGETSVGVDVSYVAPPGGEMRITISATATISLPGTASLSLLGFRGKDKDRDQEDENLKEKHGDDGTTKSKDKLESKEKDSQRPYEVSLVLAIVVRRVEGNVLFKIKRPPSNRLWYAFTTSPHMEFTVEPVVSDRRVRWGMVLTVIEGKLKEIIQESVVLPFMDDIPFFDTTPYALRGGLFADAFTEAWREEVISTKTSTNAYTLNTTTTTSAPVPGTSTNTTPMMPGTDPDLQMAQDMVHVTNTDTATLAGASSKQVHRTRSADALVPREQDAGVDEEEQRMTRAETIGSALGGARKRRTWFGKNDGTGGDLNADNGQDQANGERRQSVDNLRVFVTRDGEAPDDVKFKRPLQRHASALEDSTEARGTTKMGLSTSAPSPTMLSSSPLPSAGPSNSVLPPRQSPTPPSSRPPSTSSAPGSPAPSTSSFLSTLKLRGAGMAEKPVVKEAMRKWGVGVNWAAGLRKDGSGSGGRDRERDKEQDKGREKDWERYREMDVDMEADHGVFWGGAREGKGAGGNGRGSYADLRRKVEVRERERLKHVGGGSDDGSSGDGTQPIDIPGAERAADAPSPPSSLRPPSTHSDTPSSSSTRKVTPPGVSPNGYLNPSAPRTTTELHTVIRTPSPSPTPVRRAESLSPSPIAPRQQRMGNASHVLSTLNPVLDDSPTPVFATPIRAQPKAATMTIPGIHARHRGEVMALGSEPVRTDDGGETKGGTGDEEREGRAGGKAIQGVYRLWRGGSTPAHGQVSAEGDGEGRTEAMDARSVSLSGTAGLKSDPEPSPSLNPPPLPPRSSTQPLSSSSSSGSSSSLSSGDVDSPASQALKNVVQQDAARHPPPLPIRSSGETSSAKSVDISAPMVSMSTASPSASSSRASLFGSPAVSIADTPSSASIIGTSSSSISSDQDAGWVPLTTELNLSSGIGATVQTPRGDGNEKWRPPLPPRRSTSSINHIQA